MVDWTTEEVTEWLRKEGFERFCQNFKDYNITGADLLTLKTRAIQQLLSLPDIDETEHQQLINQFKQKLREWKQQYRENSIVQSSSNITISDIPSYTKNITLSTEKIGIYGKFFHNPLFRTHFQQYLFNTHKIDCQIQLLESQEIYLTLNGQKSHVKIVQETITNLFQSIQTKTYDNEETDQLMIYWSQNIISDAMLPVLQYIMDQQNIFTLWEKTAIFYGYLKVNYFTDQWFTVSEKQITEILKNEIIYVENLPMPNEKTMNFIKAIDQYRLNKQHSDLAIIYCKYPYKFEIKISLFGRKDLVKKTKKQLQTIITKHTIKIYSLKLIDYQYEYLLNHCLESIKDIEEEYKDDSVKIRIRQKDFSSPQYLSEKIRKKINELMFHTLVCQYQKIDNSFILTTKQHNEIQRLIENSYCRIENIEIKSSIEVYSIPKALSFSSNISNSIIEQSKEFSSKLLSVRKILVSNGSIEIHLNNQVTSIPKDLTIISSVAAAIDEGIQYINENRYVNMKNGRKILFQHWSPITVTDEKTRKKLKKSIEKYISNIFQNVSINCSNVKTIGFITSEWENIANGQNFLVEYLINQVKQELEIRKEYWRILFILTDRQRNFYDQFIEIFNRIQTDQDQFGQFSCSITNLEITLTSVSIVHLNKCKKELNNYFRTNIVNDIILTNEIDLKQWDQHTINVFYKYCLSQSVLLTMNLTADFQIRLVGSIVAVEKSLEKYGFMKEILKQRSNLQIPPPITPRTSIRGEKIRSNIIDSNTYNIYFSFCQFDRIISDRIIIRLIDEGYSVCQTSSNISLFSTLIDKSDVVLIAFSEDYSKNEQSKQELNYAKLTKKKLIPFVIRPLTNENTWLLSIAIADMFYELFDSEIEIEFKDDFDLEYDQLLSILLHHTKPGITGQIYSQAIILPKINDDHDNHYDAYFGRPSLALQKITREQRNQREFAYKQEVVKQIEREKFSEEDINELIASLILVTDDLEAILRGENPDGEPLINKYKDEKLIERMKMNAYEFLICIKRWLNQSPNVIQGNIRPFTPTGDINDAIFIIHRTEDDQKYEHIYESSDLSPPYKYFSDIPYTGWNFSNEQSHDYFQKLIKSTKPISDMYMMIEENDTAWDRISRQVNDEDGVVVDELRTPEEMRKLEELDNPNHIWKNTRNAKKFIEQKIRNIIELKELCEKWP